MRRDVREDESGGRIGAGQEDDSSEGAHGAKHKRKQFWEETPSVLPSVCRRRARSSG